MMVESNGKSEEARVRDYKIYESKLFGLFHKIGLLFYTKSDPYHVKKESYKSEEVAEEDIDVFGKMLPFFPKVDKDTVQVMINVFSGLGVDQEDNDILMVMRQFHSLKYK